MRDAGCEVRDLECAVLAARRGWLRESVVSAACFLRGLPLFVASQPKTPLRVLGIVAFDTLHVLRRSRWLPHKRISDLAVFLDFQGCANAAWDRKDFCQAELARNRQRLEDAGLGACIDAYLHRLGELESRRPPVGGNRVRFDEVRSYREAVVSLSIRTAAAIALNDGRFDGVAQDDYDVDTLCRVLMQCQIIDDVMDYAEDRSAGLPSLLTASASLSEAMGMTAEAVRAYGSGSSRDAILPLRVALGVFTVVTMIVVRGARWRLRMHDGAIGLNESEIGN